MDDHPVNSTTDKIPPTSFFEVYVSKETFKFNSSHFVAFPGFRERLHGHSYRISIRLLGSRTIGQDGYVIDFGEVKDVTKKLCKDINEYFLCPIYSPVLKITEIMDEGGMCTSVEIITEDGGRFLMPRGDVAMLPILHSTAEELAIYFWGKIMIELGAEYLLKRNIHTMEVTCAEGPGQEAVFRMAIPKDGSKEAIEELCDVRKYVSKDAIVEKPCAVRQENGKKLKVDK